MLSLFPKGCCRGARVMPLKERTYVSCEATDQPLTLSPLPRPRSLFLHLQNEVTRARHVVLRFQRQPTAPVTLRGLSERQQCEPLFQVSW